MQNSIQPDYSWCNKGLKWHNKLIKQNAAMSDEEFALYAPENMAKHIDAHKMDKYKELYAEAISLREKRKGLDELVQKVKTKEVSSEFKWVRSSKRWYDHVNVNTSEEDFEKVKPDNIIAMLEEAEERSKYIELYESVSKKRESIAKANTTKKYLEITTNPAPVDTTQDTVKKIESGLPCLYVVLAMSGSKAYKDTSSFAPVKIVGQPGFGNLTAKNAYELMNDLKESLIESCGDNPENYPKWIVIAPDTTTIHDKTLVGRLREVAPVTHIVSPFGYPQIKISGKWWIREPLDKVLGGYVKHKQGSTEWSFIKGEGFGEVPRVISLVAAGPFIAIRGTTLMKIDFDEIARKTKKKGGRWHLFPFISLEVNRMSTKENPHRCAVINSLSTQYDDQIFDMKNNTDLFMNSHATFLASQIDRLPLAVGKR